MYIILVPFGVVRCTLRFQKATTSPAFIQFQPSFIGSLVKMGNCQLLLFGLSSELKKKYGNLKFLLTQDHMELEISQSYSSTAFHLILA